jgi:hypothetical protein
MGYTGGGRRACLGGRQACRGHGEPCQGTARTTRARTRKAALTRRERVAHTPGPSCARAALRRGTTAARAEAAPGRGRAAQGRGETPGRGGRAGNAGPSATAANRGCGELGGGTARCTSRARAPRAPPRPHRGPGLRERCRGRAGDGRAPH